MKKYNIHILTLIIGLLGLMTSCDEDNGLGPIPPTGNMVLNVSNLEVLPDGWIYEGWISSGGEVISTGQFQVDDNGTVKNLTIPVESAKLENAEKFIVTIESTTDNDPAPSTVKVMSGTFGQYEANLSTNDTDGIGSDLLPASFSGKYLIKAPTTAAIEDDTSGIWFIDNSGGNNMAGLSLPVLSSGWTYEAWVIIDGTPVSTGRFSLANAADDACNYCGPLAAPNFPGEDFIQNAPTGLSFPTNLSGETVVVTIEPQPDFSSEPSNIVILGSIIPAIELIELSKSYEMMNNDVDVPSGKVLRFFGFDCTNEGCS